MVKNKTNVGMLELVDPRGGCREENAGFKDKVGKLQSYDPNLATKTCKKKLMRVAGDQNNAPTAQTATIEEGTSETSVRHSKRAEPKLLRVAEKFWDTLNRESHQEFVELKSSLHTLQTCVNDLYDSQLCTMEELHKSALGSKPNTEGLPNRMNMVADLLEDEIHKFGSQSWEHYERLGRVMHNLVNDIQSTMQGADEEKNSPLPPQSSQRKNQDIELGRQERKRREPENDERQSPCESPHGRDVYERKSMNDSVDLSQSLDEKGSQYATQKDLELRLKRIEKLFEINRSLKEMISSSTAEIPESYQSTPQDDTSLELDGLLKSEDSHEKFKKPTEYKLNETFM